MLLWGLFLCLTSPFIIIQLLSEYTLSPNKPLLLQRARLRSQAGVVDTHIFIRLTSVHYRSHRDGFEGVHLQAWTKLTPSAVSGNPHAQTSCMGHELHHPRGAGSTRGNEASRSAGHPHLRQKPARDSLESPAFSFSRIKTLIRCWLKTKTPSEML